MADAAPIRVLVVDDEPLARMRLEDLLRHEEGVEIVGAVGDGLAAVEAIRALRPDLVFLDVQMPGRTGLEVVREVGADAMPATIFVTAFDQYALQAFDVAAVDYLVKPFDDERFEQAFRRARRLLALEGMDRLRGQLLTLLQRTGGDAAPAAPAASQAPRYLERIAVEMRGQLRVVPVAQIEYITASGPYAEIHAGGRTYLIREAMQTLEERLDPARFLRVHRSAIVRLDLVEALHKGAGGDYEVQLRGGRSAARQPRAARGARAAARRLVLTPARAGLASARCGVWRVGEPIVPCAQRFVSRASPRAAPCRARRRASPVVEWAPHRARAAPAARGSAAPACTAPVRRPLRSVRGEVTSVYAPSSKEVVCPRDVVRSCSHSCSWARRPPRRSSAR